MMRTMTGTVSLLVAVVLVMFAELPRSNASVSISTASSNPLKVEYTTDNKKAVFKWSWTSSHSDTLYKIQIKRSRQNLGKKELAYYNVVSKTYGPSGYDSYFKLVVTPGSGGTGTVEFTIPDVKNQGTDSDGLAVDVLKYDYKYECTIINSGSEVKNQVTLEVEDKPRITTVPESYESSEKDKRFKMRCIATGKPLPTIAWLVTRINGQENSVTGNKVTGLESFKYGSEIPVISTNADTGVYKCTAKNRLGQDSAQATFIFTGCDSSLTCDSKEVAIEITQLNYKNEYSSMSSEGSKKLRKEIETACIDVYSKTSCPKILSCVVTKFRNGSVIANVKQVFKRGTTDPEGPLKSAIQDGKFAGYDVATSFVSPTNRPTQITKAPVTTVTQGPTQITKAPITTVTQGSSCPTTHHENECSSTGVGVLSALLGVSLLVNILFVALYVWRKASRANAEQGRKEDNLIYENDVEMVDTSPPSAAISHAPPANQPGVVYESVGPSRVQTQYETSQLPGNYEVPENRETIQDPSHYQQLNPNMSNELPENPDNRQTIQDPKSLPTA